MVAGARLALELGWEVQGSDTPLYPPTSEMVKALDIPVNTGYDASNLDWEPDIVLIGNALSRGNPEVEAVLERRMRYQSLPEWLKEEILRERYSVAICGTHGKTTTSALTAFLLDALGLEPGFLIGGQPVNFRHSARLGKQDRPFVIEGDEYDTAFFDKRAKFLHYIPHIAVVTSIEFDHGDIYKDIESIEHAFRLMLRQIPQNGLLILCDDEPRVRELEHYAFSNILRYGLSENAPFRGEKTAAPEGFQGLDVYYHGTLWGHFDVPLAGEHNLRNTLAALAVARYWDGDPGRLADALRSFKGVRRRMEIFLEAREAIFIDDFAHHPTAIRETIRACRTRWPGRRLRVLCEPRSNTMVTRQHQGALGEAMQEADEIWLGPVYRAERLPESKRLDREKVVQDLKRHGITAHIEDTPQVLAEQVWESLKPGDIILILSNGAFGGIYETFRVLASTQPGTSWVKPPETEDTCNARRDHFF